MRLPVLVVDDIFLYPFMITPIIIKDIENIKALGKVSSEALIVPARSHGARNPNSLYEAGVLGNVIRRVEIRESANIKVLFQGQKRMMVTRYEIEDGCLFAFCEELEVKIEDDILVKTLLGMIKEKLYDVNRVEDTFPIDFMKSIEECPQPSRAADLICSVLHMERHKAYEFFVNPLLDAKLQDLLLLLSEKFESALLKHEISGKVRQKLDRQNKEYFLKEQIRQINKELGDEAQKDEEIMRYEESLAKIKKHLHEDSFKEIKRQIDKYKKINQDSYEASSIQSYLDTVFEIPFASFAKDKVDLARIKSELELGHFGLEKPKERILEFFAVKELVSSRKLLDSRISKEKNSEIKKARAILCLTGPAGVGKTSLAISIANALNRKLVRIALGGLEDTHELRGHRRTYVGAMTGRIVQGLIDAKIMNPVVVLDEIDKLVSRSAHDPQAALLEILDPEQNTHFRDYYLNFSIDLSEVIFIATANDASVISGPLKDRMEMIYLHSYTPLEKIAIAKNYLAPAALLTHSIKPSELSITQPALVKLIEEYTKEAGVRMLNQRIYSICRKVAVKILEEGENYKKINVTPKNLGSFLDKKLYEKDLAELEPRIGQVYGLAYTSVGGELLPLQALVMEGKDLKLTGSLGDVMKESASIALSVAKSLLGRKMAGKLLKSKTDFDKQSLHLHVPDGATPKDGPSAGAAMVCVLISAICQIKLKGSVAMTGEVDLRGRVLPIGGLKEKLIAAYKSGIEVALIPKSNYENDLSQIPNEVKAGLEIKAVESIEEVLREVLA